MARLPSATESVTATLAYARTDIDPRAMDTTDTKSLDALETHEVTITDARSGAGDLALDEDGFILRSAPSVMSDFFDVDAVHAVYIPEMRELITGCTGAHDMVPLEHVIRGPLRMASERPDYPRQLLGWALKAHIDADEPTYRTWASNVAPPELAERCLTEPFAVYNLWRPMVPVEQKPLALCHARTVRPHDLVPAYYDGRFPGMPDSEYYPAITYAHLAHHADQRWYYFSDMTPEEVIVFKQWDSDESRARCVPHSAFEDPTSRPGAALRTSIEVRLFVLR
jgi:hypothetical protein